MLKKVSPGTKTVSRPFPEKACETGIFFRINGNRRSEKMSCQKYSYPDMYFRKPVLCRNPKILTNCELPIIGGDSACPTEPPLHLAIVVYYLSGIIARGIP